MVMRKLYRKNLQTEEQVVKLEAENALLLEQVRRLQNTTALGADPQQRQQQSPSSKLEAVASHGNQSEEATSGSSPRSEMPLFKCASCSQHRLEQQQQQQQPPAVSAIASPPTLESLTRIDQQQLEYLRHLAAEQDKTVTSLKIRIEELSTQLEVAKQQLKQSTSSNQRGGGGKAATPRQVVNRLQSKLQDALSESERQKGNYVKMKRDFQHLLGLKTKTLVESPAQLNASARELLQLMERKLAQLEHEHAHNLSLYNSKLYAVEQQTCESYAQQRIMEEEVQRIAEDVRQRDDVDVQIEQCMVGVFERLRQVEMENVLLKTGGGSSRVVPTAT